MDEFTSRRMHELCSGFVDIYAEGTPLLAAKMLVRENLSEDDLTVLRAMIEKEFLSRGWTFPEVASEGI